MKSKEVSLENGGLEVVSNARSVMPPGLSKIGNAMSQAVALLRKPWLMALAFVCVFCMLTGVAHATGPDPLIAADPTSGDLTINVLPYVLKMLGYIVVIVTAGIALWYIRPVLSWIKGMVTGRK